MAFFFIFFYPGFIYPAHHPCPHPSSPLSPVIPAHSRHPRTPSVIPALSRHSRGSGNPVPFVIPVETGIQKYLNKIH